jgi:hypothetical protein
MGCLSPHAVGRAGSTEFWYVTNCPDTSALRSLVYQNASTSPIDSSITTVVNQCIHSGANGTVNVEFDPNCTSCGYIDA